MTVRVDVQRACTDATVPADDVFHYWVERAVESAAAGSNTEVSIRVVGAAEIRELNRTYRDRDRPTNVLSFPAGPVAGLPADEPAPLGDVVVCAQVVADEAAAQGKPVADHWAHMLVHGTLHLLGFDHVVDEEAARMEALETTILAADGVPDPYKAGAKNC
jgi:probable rRNA maturation factor